MSFEFLSKSSPNKRNFTLPSKALGKEYPLIPQDGFRMETSQLPDPCLAYPSGSPVEERCLQVLFLELPH